MEILDATLVGLFLRCLDVVGLGECRVTAALRSRFPKARLGRSRPVVDHQSKGGEGPRLQVPRDQVLAFAVYTHDRGTLKLTGQLYPLMPDEAREVRLELMR